MKKSILFLFALVAALTMLPAQAMADGTQLAFPGAEGYGKNTTGGRGGKVYYVTRLDDCSDNNLVPGTLRWALRSGDDTPRTVLFKVSGTIYLTSKLKFSHPNMSILGQSAPGGGICLAGWPMYICKNNVIVRYIRFRAGDIPDTSLTGLDMENAQNVILDHCSMSWSMEECLTAYDTKYTTVQWCILGEGLYNSKNVKGSRAYATQWGGEHSSMLHTLVTNSHSRSPRFNGARDAGEGHDTYVDSEFANNVIFNWSGTGAIYGGEMKTGVSGYNRVYMINNYYRPGPSTQINKTQTYFASPSSPYGQWYANGNKFEETGTYSPWTAASAQTANADNMSALKGLPDSYKYNDCSTLPGTTYETADATFVNVTKKAGASLPRYDEVDSRLLAEAAGTQAPQFTGSIGQAGIIDSPDDVKLADPGIYSADGTVYNNYPNLGMKEGEKYAIDTDGDGMPDAYESANGLNPNDAADGAAVTALGYTNLEIYMNGIADGTINKATYETSDVATIEGETKTLEKTVDGKTYCGYIGAGVYYEAGKTYVIPEGVTLTPLVKVTFNYDGVAPATIKVGGSVTMPTAKKDGYTFKGWSDGTNTYNAETAYNFSSCVTLNPVFEQAKEVERTLYSTDFTDWTKAASSTTESQKTVTTQNSGEQLTFSLMETEVNPDSTHSRLASPATKGYLMAAKTATPYIKTSALKSITTVTYVHGATGNSRGWGLKAKGDGDADWVTVYSTYVNPAAGQKVTVDVNRKNCQLWFYNLNGSQNAYMTEMEIKGMVQADVKMYKFSATATAGGSVSQDPTGTEFEKDTKITVTATPASGYLFDSWTDQDDNVISTSSTYVHILTSDIQLTANFKTYADYAYVFEGCEPYNAHVTKPAELLAALHAAATRTDKNARYRIFVHNGTYDLESAAKTTVVANSSLIGESKDGVLIFNTPSASVTDYQNQTPVLFIDQNQNDTYFQDFTLRAGRDWAKKTSQGQEIAMRQRGKRAIYKNVSMQGVQDTYYLNKADASAYFETCDMAGEVDFIYGDGTMYFKNCNILPVSTAAKITAANTQAGYKGIVFESCTIDKHSEAKDGVAGYALGRPWGDSPCVTYLNTTMKVLPVDAGWVGMAGGCVIRYHEYNSMDANGDAIDLSKRSISACSPAEGSDAPVIDAGAASEYTLAKTFEKVAAGWSPAELTKQFSASAPVLNGTSLSWSAVEGALGYAIVKNGSVIAFTTSTSYIIEDATATYAIRVANQMGGLGEPKSVTTAIKEITDSLPTGECRGEAYNLSGQRVNASERGLIISGGKKIIKK